MSSFPLLAFRARLRKPPDQQRALEAVKVEPFRSAVGSLAAPCAHLKALNPPSPG